MVAPEIAQPGIPVADGGRRPDGVAGGALVFGKSEFEDTSGAGAGGDDGGAAPERIGDRAGQRHGGIPQV
jgi:hypothetical protein